MGHSDEINMFTDDMFATYGEAGFYVNSFGNRQNLTLIDCRNCIIYSKESIPLGNKVYLADEIYLGLVIKCVMDEKSIDNIHKIMLDDVYIGTDVGT